LTATYGSPVGMHLEWFAESRLILIWGSNSITSNLHFWNLAQKAKRAGAKLICIDPRRTETAEKCHQHIALLPGTDARIGAGPDARVDPASWAGPRLHHRHVQGWPALRERALQWPPERAAAVCGITPMKCADWRANTPRRALPPSA
jgi:anaerobic selenocysteine-containing dehydrogenase